MHDGNLPRHGGRLYGGFQTDFPAFEGIVLGHKISGAGIEVDRAKIDVIAKLPYPANVKGVRSFSGHAGFLPSKKDVKPRLIRLRTPDIGTFTEEEITNEFPDEHLIILKAELNNDEPNGLDRLDEFFCFIPAFMVVEGEVLNDFPRFVDILIAEFAASGAVNLTLKMKEDMIIKNLDMKPTIDAMMRDFWSKSLK
ncbi:hypothetical protein Tco_0566873 [Tanacetum coccineum]